MFFGALWPNVLWAGLQKWIKWSKIEPWLGHCVLFLGKTLLQCFSPLSSITGYWQVMGGNLIECWGVTCDWLCVPSRGIGNIFSCFILQNLELSTKGNVPVELKEALLYLRFWTQRLLQGAFKTWKIDHSFSGCGFYSFTARFKTFYRIYEL